MTDFAEGTPAPQPTTTAAPGLADNVAGALAYVTIIPAILFLVLEPYSRKPFIRFHAFQCIALAVVAFASSIIMIIPILGWIIGLLMMPVLFVAWLLCIIKASQGKLFKLPLIGAFVENMAK